MKKTKQSPTHIEYSYEGALDVHGQETSLRKDKPKFQKKEKKICYLQGPASPIPSTWEGAQQEEGAEIMPIWQEHKEQGNRNMI